MTDEQRPITDDLLLSELTVGEFKQLMVELLSASAPIEASVGNNDAPLEKISIRRKSLDEFMNDLGET